VIAEEFRGKGNCEIVLDEHLAGLHVYPAIDVLRTGTRREDALLTPDDLARLRRLRKAIDAPTGADGADLQLSLEALVQRVRQTGSNRELLDAL
jgi:transcription termination factor Rho